MIFFKRLPFVEGFLGVTLILVMGVCFFPSPSLAGADMNDRLADCAKIEDSAVRLKCFDTLTGRKASVQEEPRANTEAGLPAKENPSDIAQTSVLTRHWDLDPETRRDSFVIRPYRMNYFLPVAYNSSPNEATNLEYDPDAKAQYNEAKFQLSFKAKVWEDVFQKQLQGFYDSTKVINGVDVWVAYTQMAFWQVYNSAFSSPFRDINYEPELLINFRTNYEILGFKGRFFNVGFNHQSNGRSKPLSRSWNRIVASVGLERDNFNLQLKTWYRLPERESDDDNPDLTRYMGYGELWSTLFWKDMRFAVMLRNNLREKNRNAIQLDWCVTPSSLGKILLGRVIPQSALDFYLTDKFSFYVQYFNGYGEGLLDYNTSINRISAGLMIAEWN